MVEKLELAPRDGQVSQRYAKIRAHLDRYGTPIGVSDLLIADQGIALGAVVVTDNLAEFRRVPGLLTENGLNPDR